MLKIKEVLTIVFIDILLITVELIFNADHYNSIIIIESLVVNFIIGFFVMYLIKIMSSTFFNRPSDSMVNKKKNQK